MNDNKRIVLNTSVLYIKLIFSVIIGLYTSRVVLLALGVSDYGLYSVVGGIVSMMNFIGASMVSTSYRFIAVELGKGVKGNVNKVYNTVFVIHLLLAILLLIVGETIGVYYINNYLNVAQNKIPDALFILHLSLLSTVFVIISCPSNGLIIAREKFVFTSCVEIGRSVLKLLLVIGLSIYIGNKLRMFAVIMLIFNLVLPICYTLYCQIKEKNIVKWSFNKDWGSYKKTFSYSVWIMLGSVVSIFQNQGSVVLINSFFTVVMNAAFGIATQVNSYISMMVRSLAQATVPQIMKSYSAGNQNRTMSLVYMVSKYSFFIMLITSVPLILSLNDILLLWLKKVPNYTSVFVFFMLINSLVYTLECGFDSCIQATGKIRWNQIGYSVIGFLTLPINYLSLKLGMPPYTVTIVLILSTVCILLLNSYILSILTNFTYREYFKFTIFPAFKVLFFAIILCFFIHCYLSLSSIWLNIIIKTLISFICLLGFVYLFGMSKGEKKKCKEIVYNRILR